MNLSGATERKLCLASFYDYAAQALLQLDEKHAINEYSSTSVFLKISITCWSVKKQVYECEKIKLFIECPEVDFKDQKVILNQFQVD